MDFLIIFLCVACTAVLSYLYSKFNYWNDKGVVTLGTSMILGNWLQLKTMHHTEILRDIYNLFKGKYPVAGFYVYTKPVAVILDINLVQSVLVRDFNYFIDRICYSNHKDILSTNMFNLEGTKWRPLRNKLTSTFTSAKLKIMYPLILSVATELEKTYGECVENESVLNISHLNSRYTTDVIGTCAFGIDCNTLTNPQSEFLRSLSAIFGSKNFNVRWKIFKQTYVGLAKCLGFKRHPQFVEDFFLDVLQKSVMEREKTDKRRNDFLDLLIDLKNTKDENGRPSLSYNEITAQLFVFFFAGYETSSSTMNFALYMLAKHPDVQEKLRREIQEKLKEFNNDVTYEALNSMSYLDQVICETLRLYPILGFLQRHAVADYKIPNSNIVLEKGTSILIPVKCIHYDPEFYSNPDEFRPERFHPAEMVKRHPQSFLGFGDGPRNCIGLRFGKMQVRVGLVKLLMKFKFSPCPKTVDEIKYSDFTFAQKSVDDFWLKVDKL